MAEQEQKKAEAEKPSSKEEKAPKAEKPSSLVALIKTVKGGEVRMNARPEQVESLLKDKRFRRA